jgi:hypothetical protein
MNDIELKNEQTEAPTVAFVDDHTQTADPIQEQREQAFDAAHEWKGQPLEPFSSGRRREWIRLRNLDGEDPTFLDDAVKIVWLCLQSADDIITKRRNAQAMSAEIWRWADTNVGNDDNEAILELANQIVTNSRVNQAVPIPSNDQQMGN